MLRAFGVDGLQGLGAWGSGLPEKWSVGNIYGTSRRDCMGTFFM